MNNQERILAVFNRQRLDRLVWQPRLHYWYEVNKVRGTLPEEYKNCSLLEIYDDLEASPRGYHYFGDTIKTVEGDKVQLIKKTDGEQLYTKYLTPKGKLTQLERITEHGHASMRTEYFLKNVADFKVLEYILNHQRFEFDKNLYRERSKILLGRTEPSYTVPWGSIQRLFVVYMGLRNGLIALWRHREKVETLLWTFGENDTKRFNLIKKTPFRIINFGDNIDEGLCSPPLFTKYMLPYYQLRTKELHKTKKYCTSHWDGKVKRLLPFFQNTDLDGLECVPPMPQGNVSIEELKDALCNKILTDGIPALNFLPNMSVNVLKDFVYQLIYLFKPNIIVGISDMLPPDGNIEKVRMIGKIIADYDS